MTETWRSFALAIVVFGCGGTGVELFLLGHYENIYQWLPLALLTLGVVLAGLAMAKPSLGVVKALRGLMAMFLVAGAIGVYLHLKANVEFEIELRPSMAGLELVVETLRGAIPALAPGAMFQLGLVGLLACFRHPRLVGASAPTGQ